MDANCVCFRSVEAGNPVFSDESVAANPLIDRKSAGVPDPALLFLPTILGEFVRQKSEDRGIVPLLEEHPDRATAVTRERGVNSG